MFLPPSNKWTFSLCFNTVQRHFSSPSRRINHAKDVSFKAAWIHKKCLIDSLEKGTQSMMNYIEIPLQFRSITKQITTQNSSKQILCILHQQVEQRNAMHANVCAMAIRKCNLLNDSSTSLGILQFMKEHSVERNAAVYTLVIHGLCREDRLNEAFTYLNIMMADGINPTNETYTALLGGCKSRKNVSFAERIWNIMKNDNELRSSMDVIAYTVMISVYGKCGMFEKAELLWSEFANAAKDAMDEGICCSMINVYSTQMMADKAMQIMQFMKDHHIKANINHYCALIECFVRMNSPKMAMSIFYEMRSNEIDFNQMAFKQLCTVQCQLLKKELCSSKENKLRNVQTCFDELKKLSKKYEKFLRAEENKKCFGNIMFEAMMAMNENEIIISNAMLNREFERMQNEQYLDGYWHWQIDKNNEQWMIDLHFHSKDTARFIMRYIFQFEQEFLATNQNIVVICGKSSHSLQITTEQTMKSCIIQELSSWKPPIHAVVDKHNNGRLILNAGEVANYLSYNNRENVIK